MNAFAKNGESGKTPVETKRPYQTPMLSEYGDIREITQNVGSKGATDGKGNAKTGAG